ncbi:MAG: hydroxymethylpyrimidine/phosphomethylpyrimidine kinase [Verrucomicrobiota bacterium]
MPHPRPVILSIAGSDCSAGAGIQADLKAIHFAGGYATTVVSAIVAEAPGSVGAIEPVSIESFVAQLEQVTAHYPIAAAKTGMLATGAHVDAVCQWREKNRGVPLVVDPVFKASAGAELLDEHGVEKICRELIPLATLVTPNLSELEVLCQHSGQAPTKDLDQLLLNQAASSRTALLLTGGHVADGTTIVDRAAIDGRLSEFRRPRVEGPDLHGTGCTLSSLIATRLALGSDLEKAIAASGADLAEAIRHHHKWSWQDAVTEALNLDRDTLT